MDKCKNDLCIAHAQSLSIASELLGAYWTYDRNADASKYLYNRAFEGLQKTAKTLGYKLIKIETGEENDH